MSDNFTEMPCGCATLSIEKSRRNITVTLAGPTTKPSIVGSQANQLAMLITIEFKPAGLYALTGIHQSELTDETIPLEAINTRLCKQLMEAAQASQSVDALATRLDTALLENMYTACHPQLMQALHSIISCDGITDMKRLARDVHYSERQLSRMFRQHVGMSTKSFSRIVRINNAFRLLKKAGASLTLVSDVMGFHDVSHFVRDFKSVCGITPQTYRSNMSDFYINSHKF